MSPGEGTEAYWRQRYDEALWPPPEHGGDEFCTPGCPDDVCRSMGCCAWPKTAGRAMATGVATPRRGTYGCRVDRQQAISSITRGLAELESSDSGRADRTLAQIRTTVQLRAELDALLTDYVVEARKPRTAGGWWSQGINGVHSWGEVARVLGVSKQAAIKRYGQATVDRWGDDARGYGGASTGACPVKQWPETRPCGRATERSSPYCDVHTTRPVPA